MHSSGEAIRGAEVAQKGLFRACVGPAAISREEAKIIGWETAFQLCQAREAAAEPAMPRRRMSSASRTALPLAVVPTPSVNFETIFGEEFKQAELASAGYGSGAAASERPPKRARFLYSSDSESE